MLYGRNPIDADERQLIKDARGSTTCRRLAGIDRRGDRAVVMALGGDQINQGSDDYHQRDDN